MDFAQEFSNVSQQIDTLRNDLQSLKEKAAPLLCQSPPSLRKAALYPGPGSYSLAGVIGNRSPVAHKPSPQTYTFSRADHSEAALAPANRESPPPNHYRPNLSLTTETPRVPKIRRDNISRLSYIDSLGKRSPGPIYSPSSQQVKTTVFGRAQREGLTRKTVGPSPGEYTLDKSFQYLRGNLGGKFGCSNREQFKKLGEAHSVVRGATGPGPVYDPVVPYRNHRVAKLNMTGHAPPHARSDSCPPVGTYTPVLPKTGKAIAMPKAARFDF